MVTTRRFGIAARSPRHWDRGVLVLLLAFVALLPLFTAHFYATDSVQYYAYLRSLYFDGDLDFGNEYARFNELFPSSGIDRALLPRTDPDTGTLLNVDPKTHKPVNVAPVGSAILWTPAFFVAHGGVLLARALGSDVAADGYSRPYIVAICLASALYGLIGLLLSYRVARRWTGMWPATAAALLCWLASPLVFYMLISPAWSHTGSLFATALFVWYWLRTRPDPALRQWLLLGLIGGLMIMTREQLGLFLLLPALDALRRYWEHLRARAWRSIGTLIARHALFVLALVVAVTPQLVAYLVLNGRLGPSTVVLEKVGFVPPDPYAHGLPGSAHFWDTLIDPRPSPATGLWFAHGAFVWTPIWGIALLGLLLLWRRDRWIMALLLLAFFAQVWVNGSFGTTWHLSGAFGFRRLIEATPLFALGLALIIERLRVPRAATVLIGLLFVAWNVGLIYQWAVLGGQYRAGLVWSGMLDRQLAVPREAISRIDQLVFDRCSLAENSDCR